MISLNADQTKIAVVGAGITGRAIAFALLRSGFSVSLFDAHAADSRQSCSWQAGGMIAPWSEASECEASVLLAGLYARSLWPLFAREMGSTAALHQQGTRLQYHPQDEQLYLHFLNRIIKKAQNASVLLNQQMPPFSLLSLFPMFAQVYTDTSQQIANELGLIKKHSRDENQLKRIVEQQLLTTESHTCPRCVMEQLEAKILEEGGRWYRQAKVVSVEKNQLRFLRQQLQFDRVIDTTGTGAKDLTGLPVRGVRGEALLIRSQAFHSERVIRFLHPRYPIYLIPREKDNLFYLGASQLESESLRQISMHSCLHLMSAAIAISPELADAELVDSYVGTRPALLSNRPGIRVTADAISVNGLYRHGYLLAPLVAAIVVDLLKQDLQGNLHANHQKSIPGFDLSVESVPPGRAHQLFYGA